MKNSKNIFKNKVTRDAILYTLLILFIYRIGSYIPTPGVNIVELQKMQGEIPDTLFSFFGGGSIASMSIFALGIAPYITSSIMIQLLESDLIPSMSQWKHQGVDGQNKRTKYTKRLALFLAFLQALGISFFYYSYSVMGIGVIEPYNFAIENKFFDFLNYIPVNYVLVALIMTAGTALLMWFADRVTEKGVGNGMSVMIVAGILAVMPTELNTAYNDIIGGSSFSTKEFITWLIILIITILVIIMVVGYSLAYRKIPINYVRSGRNKVLNNSYLPIKLNPAGVIPVIFAQPLMLLLNLGMVWIYENFYLFTNDTTIGNIEKFFRAFTSYTVDGATNPFFIVYILFYGSLIVGFSIIYSQIQMNPEEMAKNLQKQSAYVVGVRPGKDTLDYFTNIISKVSLWGGLFLAFIAVLPTILTLSFDIASLQLLGTGLIIVVSVFVQIFQSLVSKIESKNYRYLLGGRK
jgi:preprotein translocase subunit SecY